MDCNLDREIRLTNETEYKSLYSWSLQEFDNDGKEIGSKQVPWYWTQSFTVSELRFHQRIETEDSFDVDEGDFRNGKEKAHEKRDYKVNYSEKIVGTLHSGYCDDGENLERETSYSMFGTGRNIKTFSLRIVKTDDKERCMLTGGISFDYEVDFRDESVDDYVEVLIWLLPEKYNAIVEAIKTKSPDVVHLTLGRVSGLYSEWSPSISTSHIKILTNHSDDQKITIPDDCDAKPPRLREVGEFSLSITQRHKLNPKLDLKSLDIDNLFEDEWDKEYSDEEIVEKGEKGPSTGQVLLLAQLAQNQKTVSKLLIPLWLIFILLVVTLLI